MFGLMIGLLFLGCGLSPDQKTKLLELRQVAAETPKFADFEQLDYSEISKSDNSVVAYFYRSSASYEDVKNFYTEALSSRGWSSPQAESVPKWLKEDGSRRLIFTKGEYIIDVEYDAAEKQGWRFAVDYAWQAK
jgi:hypothetical protein